VNRNRVPGDRTPARVTAGIRIGLNSAARRGLSGPQAVRCTRSEIATTGCRRRSGRPSGPGWPSCAPPSRYPATPRRPPPPPPLPPVPPVRRPGLACGATRRRGGGFRRAPGTVEGAHRRSITPLARTGCHTSPFWCATRRAKLATRPNGVSHMAVLVCHTPDETCHTPGRGVTHGRSGVPHAGRNVPHARTKRATRREGACHTPGWGCGNGRCVGAAAVVRRGARGVT
jgi:hypothetical protein